jgi:DNA polymerase elongation subunit (family B)
MPCDVVADAIVSKGREALENAIHMINSAPSDKYNGATVIYGDTDSCFVLFKGRIVYSNNICLRLFSSQGF